MRFNFFEMRKEREAAKKERGMGKYLFDWIDNKIMETNKIGKSFYSVPRSKITDLSSNDKLIELIERYLSDGFTVILYNYSLVEVNPGQSKMFKVKTTIKPGDDVKSKITFDGLNIISITDFVIKWE